MTLGPFHLEPSLGVDVEVPWGSLLLLVWRSAGATSTFRSKQRGWGIAHLAEHLPYHVGGPGFKP